MTNNITGIPMPTVIPKHEAQPLNAYVVLLKLDVEQHGHCHQGRGPMLGNIHLLW